MPKSSAFNPHQYSTAKTVLNISFVLKRGEGRSWQELDPLRTLRGMIRTKDKPIFNNSNF